MYLYNLSDLLSNILSDLLLNILVGVVIFVSLTLELRVVRLILSDKQDPIKANKKTRIFDVECPHCNTTFRSDEKNSPIYRLNKKDVRKIYYGEEMLCTCPHCKKNFRIYIKKL